MTVTFVCWCDRRFGERDAFERHVINCKDAPPTIRRRREDGSEAGPRSVLATGSGPLCKRPLHPPWWLGRPFTCVPSLSGKQGSLP